MSHEQDGWNEYQLLVLHRLDSLDARMEKVEEYMVLSRIDQEQRKMKAGLWGAMAGMVPAFLGFLGLMFFGGTHQ